MDSFRLSSIITVIANCIAQDLTSEEIALVSAIFVQLGDTLVTIAAQKALCYDDSSLDNKGV